MSHDMQLGPFINFHEVRFMIRFLAARGDAALPFLFAAPECGNVHGQYSERHQGFS